MKLNHSSKAWLVAKTPIFTGYQSPLTVYKVVKIVWLQIFAVRQVNKEMYSKLLLLELGILSPSKKENCEPIAFAVKKKKFL